MIMKKTKEIEAYLTYNKKTQVLKYAKEYGNNSIAYKFFGVKKSTFYKWKKAYEEHGEEGLLRKKPTPRTFPNQIKQEVVNKVLELREEHKLGTWRIKWYFRTLS